MEWWKIDPRSGAANVSLLKVMVMLGDAPADFIAKLTPPHAELCTRGRKLRAQLPSHLNHQQALITTYCPLPAVLQSLVVAYALTTPEDMWADGLRISALEEEMSSKHLGPLCIVS
jgi:hypothetical protein